MANPFHNAIKIDDSRVHQGDIFSNISFYENYYEEDGNFELTIFDFPNVVVLTQECDLEQNKKKREDNQKQENGILKNNGHLVSILVAPLYNAEHLKIGKHLDEIGVACEDFGKKFDKIKQNDNSRYHCIQLPNEFEVPLSVVDFKHYFSVSIHTLEQNITNRICTIEPLYKANIVQRFANFLSRIGLPDPI